jgi:putative endonuclease
MGSYWVYILQVTNGTYYTGCTTDVHRRYREHVDGRGRCRYTRSFPPVRLVQCWRVLDSRGAALRIERFVKKKPRVLKSELVRNPELLPALLRKSRITDAVVETCGGGFLDGINTYTKGKPPGKGGKKPGGHR